MTLDIPALLEELNRLDESPRIEAKAASAAIGKSLMETVSAFSNTPGLGGGYLLLGVSSDEPNLFGQRYMPTGVTDPDKVMMDVASQCSAMLNVAVRPEMDRAEIGGRVVVGVFIPEAEAEHKPVYIASRSLPKGAYLRVGSTDQRCTDADLPRFYQARSIRPFDDTLLPETTLADRSAQALANYRRERRRRDPDAPELDWDDEKLLRGLKLVRDDAQGVARLTVAGALLFGTADVIRDLFPATRVDYIRVQGRTWVPDAHDRFTSLDRLGPIFEVVYATENAIMDELPVAFSLPEDSLHRLDKPLIPRDVIREALVNALMHRDYQAGSPTQIIRYSDRIEFRNKGYSLKPEEELGMPGSELRNRRMADVLHQTRLAETKGTGIRAMRRQMVEADLTPPFFESSREQNRFIATLRLHHFVTAEAMVWLARFDALGLSREDKQALLLAHATGRLTNADYRNLNSVDTLTASQALRRLRDAGLLVQHDRGASTFYTLPDGSLNPTPERPAAEATQHSRVATQGRQEATQEIAVATLGEDGAHASAERVGRPERITVALETWDALPVQLRRDITRAGLRATHAATRQILTTLCGLQPWTAAELADHSVATAAPSWTATSRRW